MYLVTIVSLAVLVRVSAPLRQFLRVRSILSIPISAQSVAHAQVYVLLRPSACPNQVDANTAGGALFGTPPALFIYNRYAREKSEMEILNDFHD